MARLTSGSEATRWLAGPAAGWLDWRQVRYCFDVAPEFKADLIARLLPASDPEEPHGGQARGGSRRWSGILLSW